MTMFTNGFSTLQMPEDFEAIEAEMKKVVKENES